jgi:phage terminase large subunit-like protein
LLPESKRKKILASLTNEEAALLRYSWDFWARPDQREPPGNWQIWLVKAGRGFGKTWLGAHWVRSVVERRLGRRGALVGGTYSDVRDVMVEGPSGILAICPPWFRPDPQYNRRRLLWPNGAETFLYTAEEPDRLRGPQHDFTWGDELAAWRYEETYDQLMFGLRQGANPRALFTTTPRPTRLIRELVKDPRVHVTTGTSYDNRVNLPEVFFHKIIKKYEGTRLGRQELLAEILDDNPKALWKRAMIENHRVSQAPELSRVVVAIDPAVTSNMDSDETGIVVVGRAGDQGFVLGDYSDVYTPDAWARQAVKAYYLYKADRIVAEVNNGGDMVEAMIRNVDSNVPYRAVHASRGKALRAEPVAALYEQGRCHHVGSFPALEDQMCEFDPTAELSKSPDRMDALVWGFSDLFALESPDNLISYYGEVARRQRLPARGEEWREPSPAARHAVSVSAPSQGGELHEVYLKALRGLKQQETCSRCGGPLGADRMTDGYTSWHPRCPTHDGEAP